MRGLVVVSVIIVAVAALALPAPVIVLAGIPFALALRLVLLGLDGERGLPMLVSTSSRRLGDHHPDRVLLHPRRLQ